MIDAQVELTSQRLFPSHHIGGKIPAVDRMPKPPVWNPQSLDQAVQPHYDNKVAYQKAHARFEKRQTELAQAPDLDTLLRQELKDKGQELPENKNLSLEYITQFRRIAHETQDLRQVLKQVSDPKDKQQAFVQYSARKKLLDQMQTKYGLSFEKAYREYIRSFLDFSHYMSAYRQVIALENLLGEQQFASLPKDVKLDDRARARINQMMRHSTEYSGSTQDLQQEARDLATVYPEGSQEYQDMLALLTQKQQEKPALTKAEMLQQLTEARKTVTELWGDNDNMVRYFWYQKEMTGFLEAFARGDEVLETQTVIKALNQLYSFEQQHQRTTIGAVVVGPPGTGKTTLVRHYLKETYRHYGYIDLSTDVTRYLLYGSKEIKTGDVHGAHEYLITRLETMTDDEFAKFVAENRTRLLSVMNSDEQAVSDAEATTVVIAQIQEALNNAGETNPQLTDKIKLIRGRMTEMAQKAYRRELASEFAHLVNKNGWRDGMVIALLRRGACPIFDEFQSFNNWTLLYSLATARRGEKWYFADNDEWIDIPDNWSMFFTGNIGRKHGGFVVAEALASRAQGKVIEYDFPPKQEEMKVALATLANPEGDFLRSEEDLAKLYYMVYNLFPSIRSHIADKPQSIPISYRTILDMGEKLIQYRDPKTKNILYHPTQTSFDQALYQVIVETYALYEDKTVPREIVRLATTAGLLLDDDIKDKVMAWIGEDTYNANKTAHAQHKTDFLEIVRQIQSDTNMMMAFPEFKTGGGS